MNFNEVLIRLSSFLTIDKLANFIEIGTFIFAVMIWVKVRTQNKRIIEAAIKCSPKFQNFKESINYHKDTHSTNPVALALSLTENVTSIKPQVLNFLKISGWEKKIAIKELNFDGLGPDNLEEFMNKLRETKRVLMAESVTEIHLFISGPMVAAVLIGAMFDNLPIPVKLYQPNKNKPEFYEYWMPLEK
jgi:hypothetical protein